MAIIYGCSFNISALWLLTLQNSDIPPLGALAGVLDFDAHLFKLVTDSVGGGKVLIFLGLCPLFNQRFDFCILAGVLLLIQKPKNIGEGVKLPDGIGNGFLGTRLVEETVDIPHQIEQGGDAIGSV